MVFEQIVNIDSHMRPVKRADTQVNDAGRDLAPLVIGEANAGGNLVKAAGAKARHGKLRA